MIINMKIHNLVFGLPGFFGRAMAPKIHLAQSPVHHPGTSHAYFINISGVYSLVLQTLDPA